MIWNLTRVQEDIAFMEQSKLLGENRQKRKWKYQRNDRGKRRRDEKLKMQWPILNHMESSQENWYRGKKSD